MVTPQTGEALRQRAWEAAASVVDPEIPVLTIADLGVLREVTVGDGGVEVAITPTYSGCPAMNMIALEIELALARAGIAEAKVRTVLSPAWTTDWIGPQAREKLRRYGIAPPGKSAATGVSVLRFASTPDAIRCPRCGSARTEALSAYGSTPCKSLYRCLACREPFDWFKTH